MFGFVYVQPIIFSELLKKIKQILRVLSIQMEIRRVHLSNVSQKRLRPSQRAGLILDTVSLDRTTEKDCVLCTK